MFENYVFFRIKHCNPRYVYREGAEVDFLTKDKTLIEVKYNSEMTKKQLEIFKNFKANKKVIIKNIWDLENFLKEL